VSTTVGPRQSAATDALRPFVPRIAADWLRDEPGILGRTFEGTLVFADVSGFTELTEKLAQRGREGAEEIATVLDAAFAELIAAAYAHHADLLKFGGDAVLLLFRGENHAHRAATAALGMQRALTGMRRMSTSAGPVRLRMSVGVHSGTFHFFLVGGVHRELVIAGAGATACVETESIAGVGEVMLSAPTAALFDPALLGPGRDGMTLLARTPDSPQIVPPFFDPSGVDLSQLLPAAYTRELRGEPAEPEHRHVACAFVEILGTDELLERAGIDALATALDERITTIQESCLSFDVTFAQTDVSRKAVKAILLAGAPRSAGGDEEELMLRACRAIVERPGTLPVRVGVNAGRVFAGIVGPPTRRTYTFYGDAINTAARIMVRGEPGQLLAREEALERARTTYELAPVEPFAAKGKSALVRAFAVGAAVGEREPEAIGPLMGRAHELDRLLDALRRAREGHGALALVEGEPGLGKTRLLGELRAQASGVRTLRAQCAQVTESVPYGTAGALVRRVLELGPHAPATDVERRLRETVGAAAPQLEPWLPLLGMVLGLDLPPTAETAALGEHFVSERVAEVVDTFLGALVPVAALVVVDDVHFMDEASVELLGRLLASVGERRWLVAVARREYDGGLRPELGPDVVHVVLEPLEAQAARRLVDELTDDAPLPGHVADAVARRSGGSPLFVTEMVAALRAGADVDALPDSVESLLAVQIDELPAADRALLRQASVLGARFTRRSFATALGLREDDAEAVLVRLGDLLVADGEGGVRFRHGLLRDAAYHGLSFRRRRLLHRRVAESLERDSGGDDAALVDQLTRHFYEAGVWEKALRYGGRAGSAAARVYANVDAAGMLERAVEAGSRWRHARPEEVARAAETLGDVRITLGELERAADAFAIARRRVRGDPVERARLMRKEASVAILRGEYVDARRRLTRGLVLLDGVCSVSAASQRARIEALLGIVAFRQGRARDAVGWFERAIADGEAVDAKKALAHALYGIDQAYAALGQPERGAHSVRALAIYDELGDLVRKAGVLNNLGVLAYYAGRWDEAVGYYRRAREAWERAGDRSSVSMASFNIGEILSAQGHLDEAEPLLREADRASQAAGGATDMAESAVETALLEARRGDVELALDRLREARAVLAEAGDEHGALLAEARIAETLVLAGDPSGAAAVAGEALERGAGDAGGMARPVLLRVLGWACLVAGDAPRARAALDEALAAATQAGHRYEEAMTLDVLVRLDGAPAELTARRDGLFESLGIVAVPLPRPAVPTR
jgi:class 3 adenylate cyclase/tetratricopeptide (TPR) repeat protein